MTPQQLIAIGQGNVILPQIVRQNLHALGLKKEEVKKIMTEDDRGK